MSSGVKQQTFDRESSWYANKPRTDKRLLIVLIVVALLAVSFFVAFLIVLYKTPDRDVCTTPGCIHASSYILEHMDPSVDPCDDFYHFSCGGYIKNNTIPEDKAGISTFEKIYEKIVDQLKLLIEEPLPPRASKPYRLIKKIYNMCMNTSAIEKTGLTVAKSMLKQVGGWPILEGSSWNENAFEWKQMMYKLRKLGFSTGYFVSVYICSDDKNSMRRVLCLDEGSLSLSREFIIKGMNEKLVKANYEYAIDLAKEFGANEKDAVKEMKEVFEFQIKLAKLKLPKEDRRNSSVLYNPMTVDELQTKYPTIPWLEYINRVLDIPDIEVTDQDIVIVAVPEYFNKLDNLLRQTPKRVQANRVMFSMASSMVFYLTEKLKNRQQEYYREILGTSERTPRWKDCTNVATGSLNLASGAAFVRKFLRGDARKHAQELVTDIKSVFLDILKKIDWMDPLTRKNAIEKAEAMIHYIGYPDELLDEKKVNKHYANLDINTDNFLEASRMLSLFFSDFYNKRYRQPVNKTEWISHSYPTVVNAFYSASENSIEFPAGILQGVFFSDDRPRYLNYGGIGYVIGHEITHGFDDEGRQYDKDGNLNEWWDEETKTAFEKKAQCIIDQYGNYTVPELDLNLNGISTQGENIADNGGIKEAYQAYNAWVKRNGHEKKLPGLDLTPKQLFWVSAANTWCSKSRKEVLKLQVMTGYHSPSVFRVNGVFGNSKHFSADFNCPIGSKMNPVHKCEVW